VTVVDFPESEFNFVVSEFLTLNSSTRSHVPLCLHSPSEVEVRSYEDQLPVNKQINLSI
jgi:hypothetical protein